MTLAGNQPPEFLLDGFSEEIWNLAPNDSLDYVTARQMMKQVMNDIPASANWVSWLVNI